MTRDLPPINHGTTQGHHAELNRGIPTCAECRAAVQKYNSSTPRHRSQSPILARLRTIASEQRGEWVLVTVTPTKATARSLVFRLRGGTWPAYMPLPEGSWEYEWRNDTELWAIVDRPPSVPGPIIRRPGRPKKGGS